MKRIIKSFINRLGYQYFKVGYQPIGYNFCNDLKAKCDLNERGYFFDIGANIGEFSKEIAENFPKSKIFAFEPISTTYNELTNNTLKYSNIQSINVGLGEIQEEVKVFLQKDSGLNSFNSAINKPDSKNDGKFEKINVIRIQDFCTENNIDKIELLKTDAEGLDVEVLKGAMDLFKNRKIKSVFAEVSFYSKNERNTPFEKLSDFLIPLGFELLGFYHQSNFGNKKFQTCANALFVLQE